MGLRMKALKSFRGRPGEGDESGRVKSGREFEVANESRARELEEPPHGNQLAVRVGAKAEPVLLNKMEPAPANKAADAPKPMTSLQVQNDTLPLSQAGGETGTETSPSLSRPGRQQRPRRSQAPKAEPDSSQ